MLNNVVKTAVFSRRVIVLEPLRKIAAVSVYNFTSMLSPRQSE